MQMCSCKGFLQGSCHVLITVFQSRKSRQTALMSKAYTCPLLSVCPHKLLWLTEKHLCLCVLPWRQGHPNSRNKQRGEASVREVQMGLQCENGSKSAHSTGPGFLSRKISLTVGGRGQAVHKQRQGGIYGSGCCV